MKSESSPLPHSATHGLAHPKYRPDIDGLRGIAVLAVVAFHAAPGWIRGGFVGVDIFFVISGFLISSIIFKSLDSGKFSFAEFYTRRVKRIFPALAVVLFATYAFGWFTLMAEDYRQLGKHLAGGAGFLSNFILWNESGYFDRAAETKPLLHLWSLGIEEQFYLVWPLLLYVTWLRRLNALHVILGIAVVSFLINVLYASSDPVADFYSPLSRFWELLVGSVLAYLTLRRGDMFGARANAASLAGLVFIVAAVVVMRSGNGYPGAWALVPTLGAFLCIGSGMRAWANRNVLANRVLVWFGLISYPLYLWHWPLLVFARTIQFDKPSAEVRLALIAVSIALAWVTYVLVERPVRFGRRTPIKLIAPCVSLAAILVAGSWVYVANGLPGRAINSDEKTVFLHYYDSLLRRGLHQEYRDECNFYDSETNRSKPAIDPACTRPGRTATYLLWGDSHAQALSVGLRSILPKGAALAQVATSGCAPGLVDEREVPSAKWMHCYLSNRHALAAIERIRPEIVFLAQSYDHELTNWSVIVDRVKRAGVQKVIVIGPVPRWRPSLPLVVAKHHFNASYDRVSTGLDPESFNTDLEMRKKYGRSTQFTYVSLIERLCDRSGCLARVPGAGEHDLMAVDYGHLSPAGSVFVAQQIIRPTAFGANGD